MGPILCVVHWQCASDLCSIAVAGDGDSSSASIDIQLLNHIPDEAKHVHLEIVVGHSACRVYQKEYVSLFPARSSCILTLAYQTYSNMRSNYIGNLIWLTLQEDLWEDTNY